MPTNHNKLIGALVIVLGFALISNYFNILHFNIWSLWPLIFIYLGVQAEQKFANGGSPKNLLKGAIFLTLGVLFLISSLVSLRFTSYLWTLYLLGPGLGYLHMASVGYRPKRNFKNGILLVVISLGLFINNIINLKFELFFYVAIILFGIYLISKNKIYDGESYYEVDKKKQSEDTLSKDDMTTYQYGWDEEDPFDK